MAVNGNDLKRLREKRGWKQSELADVLNQALGRNYGSGSVSPWEQGKRPIPPDVGAFVEELLVEAALGEPDPRDQDGFADAVAAGLEPQEPPPASGDTPPGAGPTLPQPVLSPTGGTWAKACAELWEMVAAGVGMLGAATGSASLVEDGAIILADAPALGAAWGRLAETNETFRRFLASTIEGGTWVQVALATGTTFSKCYQNHALRSLEDAGRAQTAGANGHADTGAYVG